MILKELLEKKGMSAYALSKKSGVPQSTLNNILKGKSNLNDCRLKTLTAIANTLGVSIAELKGEKEGDKMGKVISIVNQKGGVGKTTTSINLGIGLVNKGKKVLIIDSDPQGSATASLGIDIPDDLEVTLYTIIRKIMNGEEIKENEGILKHEEGVEFLPGNIELSAIQMDMISRISRERILKDYIDTIRNKYDYILIDCMPSLDMLTINALTASDSVIIPVEPSFLPVKGLEQLVKTIFEVKKQLNKTLNIDGILLSKAKTTTNNYKFISDQINKLYGNDVIIFDSIIPFSVRAEECPNFGVSIFKHDPNGRVANAFKSLTEEVINNG